MLPRAADRSGARAAVAAALVFIGLLAAPGVAAADPYRLAPYKDDLFKYPDILSSEDNGDFVVVGYDKQRDLYERDQVPERKVWPQYVSGVARASGAYQSGGNTLQFFGAGKVDGGAKAVVIYIHGQGGTRFQGVDDGMFGGNFNRIMNLMAGNDGAYISPDFTDIGPAGAADIKALVLDQARRSPGAALFIACGSQGGAICWDMLADAEVVPRLSGVLLLGSGHDEQFLKSPLLKPKARRVPIFIGHGTLDPIFAWQDEADFYKRLRKTAPGYPVKLAVFDTGVHGTPIRMVDWRLVLNWMLEVDGR
jgi:predicted esterase